MTSVAQITLPNGKLYTAKPLLGAPLQSIVGQVVEKNGLTGSYALCRDNQKEQLDLSKTWRQSGLPHGVKLRLVQIRSSTSAPIKIALQIPSIGRLIADFTTSNTFYSILDHFQSQHNLLWRQDDKGYHQSPRVLVQGREIKGVQSLWDVKVQDLGLTGGNVLVRLDWEATDRELEDVKDAFEATLMMKAVAESESQSNQEMDTRPDQSLAENVEESTNHDEKELEKPAESPPLSNSQIDSDKQMVEEDAKRSTWEAKGKAALHPVTQIRPPAVSPPSPNIESPVLPTAAQTANPSPGHNGATTFDRDMKYFLPSSAPPLSLSNLPDSFFKLTSTEIAAFASMLQEERSSLENAPLKTAAMREAEEKSRKSKYPKTIIRLKMPDQSQLQITFLTDETVKDMYRVVEEIVGDRDFQLKTGAPKLKLLEGSTTLWRSNLTPASVIIFDGSREHLETIKHNFIPQQLPSTPASSIPSKPIPQDAHNRGHSSSEETQAQAATTRRVSDQKANTSTSSMFGDAASKMPKWFKKGKK